MFRSVASKVAWVGRTASTVFGLALVLALLFGVASMAFANDGQSFLLGARNVAQSVSTLVKQGAGPALSLQVDSGPPLKVNSSRKVSNLNADTVDGLDSQAFTTGKQAAIHADRITVSSTTTDLLLLTVPNIGEVRGDCDLTANTTRLHFVASRPLTATMDRGGTDAELALLTFDQRQSTSANTGVERVVWQTTDNQNQHSVITATAAHQTFNASEFCGFSVLAIQTDNEV